jgi:hypothetical protein
VTAPSQGEAPHTEQIPTVNMIAEEIHQEVPSSSLGEVQTTEIPKPDNWLLSNETPTQVTSSETQIDAVPDWLK